MLKKTKEDIFQLASTAQLFAGHLVQGLAATTDNTIANITPIDNSLIGHITNGTGADVDHAVKVARAGFESGEWSQLAPAERKRILLKWVELLEQHAEELAALDCVDAGKPITECIHTDIPATIDTLRWYAEAVDKCYGRIAPTGTDALGLIVHEPIGVVGAVLPWNFPAQMYAWKVGPALAAGNAVIVKPAELTSLSAYRMTELAYEAGVPKHALSVVTGLGETVGKAMGLHPDIDVVSFTGSTEVGRLFLTYSAQSNLKEIILECGGKSPQVVFEDANLEKSIPHFLAAAFWNMGENCSCGSRLIVHESIKDKVLELVKSQMDQWVVGNPMDPSVQIGPLVEEAHFTKVKGFIEDSLKEGATLWHGGRIHKNIGSGWYIEPTIFDDVTPNMRLFQEEVFGPILAISTFSTEAEAIALANNSAYGLAASIYTLDVHRAQRVSRAIKAGTVSINGFSEGDITTPFGGFKQSGFGGKDNGMEAFAQYQQVKTIWYVND